MARLYVDENVPCPLVVLLRDLGHDLLTALVDGRANQKIPDPDVLSRATDLGRAVLTNNRDEFHALHARRPDHGGIVTFTRDPDYEALAGRIDAAVAAGPLAGRLIRIVRPA